jgi:hypothetical protein
MKKLLLFLVLSVCINSFAITPNETYPKYSYSVINAIPEATKSKIDIYIYDLYRQIDNYLFDKKQLNTYKKLTNSDDVKKYTIPVEGLIIQVDDENYIFKPIDKMNVNEIEIFKKIKPHISMRF